MLPFRKLDTLEFPECYRSVPEIRYVLASVVNRNAIDLLAILYLHSVRIIRNLSITLYK